jgi:hypothetical protein
VVAATPRGVKRTWITTGVMLVIVTVLGLFVYLKPPARESGLQTLSTLRPNDAGKIRIERRGKPVIELEKHDGKWMITAPYAAPVDVFQVARALTVLDAKSTASYAANDLAKFDLEPPSARVTINDQTFAFGAINPVTREQYVLAAKTVHVVEMRHGAGLPLDASALLSKQLFSADEVPVRFEFTDFSVSSKDGKWSLTRSAGAQSQDDLMRWVDRWRQASSARVEPPNKGTPLGEIRIEFKNGKHIALGILSREPELILLRPDLNLQYAFAVDVGKRMLAPPIAEK